MSTPAPDSRCALAWQRDDLPAWGTAACADFWVALEQPGPWGAKALTQSRLDPEVGAALDARISDLGGRIVLVRRPGRHVDEGCSTPRWVLLCGGPLGARWMGRVHVIDPGHLLDLLLGFDPTVRPDWAEECPPQLLVCTNGKRDQCCALEGRSLVGALAASEMGGQCWEASHLGGHRFAPTALVMPTGQALARLDPAMAFEALAEAAHGRPLPAGPRHDRGLAQLTPADQVVDVWARHSGADPATVRAVKQESTELLPSSCGAAAIPVVTWRVEHA